MEETLAKVQSWLPKDPTSLSQNDAEQALSWLERIQSASGGTREDLLSVPLEDMKTLSQLMKIVVVFGLWPRMDPRTIPCPEERSKWSFSPASSREGLAGLVHKLTQIIRKKDDVSDILLISPFLLDILAASIYFEEDFEALSQRVPTYRLYQLLTKLIPAAPWFQSRVSNKLSRLPLERADSLRCLLEFITGFRDKESMELGHLDKAVTALAAFPSGASPKEYVYAVGLQLYTILSSTKLPEDLASSAGILSSMLADQRPPLVGTLRDLILRSFYSEGYDIEPPLIALSRIPSNGSFFRYLSGRLVVPVWLLAVWLQSRDLPNGSTLKLIRSMLLHENAIDLLLQAINSQTWYGHLGWNRIKGTVAATDTVFSAPSPSERLDLFITILANVKDGVVTKIFVRLVNIYPSPDPQMAFQQAQMLERIGTDLKHKLFDDPAAIVELCAGLLRKPMRTLETNSTADSDDEDDENDENDYTLEELSLNLLSGLLMEGAVDEVASQRALLDQKGRSPVKSIREKATYCIALLESLLLGSHDSQGGRGAKEAPSLLESARSALQEPLVPARAHGLHMVGELVRRKEISVSNAMDVYLKELADDDSFIYLNAIKGIETCALQEPGVVVEKLTVAGGSVEVALRRREALTRVVQQAPQGALGVDISHIIADTLLRDIRVTSHTDIRLRVSAVSLLGWLVSSSPHVLSTFQEREVVDCTIGILRHESESSDELGAALRRGAVVLALEVSNSLSEGGFQSISSSERQSLVTLLGSVASNDHDETVRAHAHEILESLHIH